MDALYEEKYHKIEEEEYWWFISRRDMILRLIRKMNLNKNAKILEIGCSGGPLIKLLNKEGFLNITGIDVSESGINLCKKRGIDNVKVMDGTKTFFDDNEFDLVIASDVLEHIKEDNDALSDWYRILKPNGKLIVFVPAFNFLWTVHDEINHHYRRYSRNELKKKVIENNFKLKKSSYWNFFIFLPVSLLRLFQNLQKRKNKKEDQLYEVNSIVNKILIGLLKIENIFLSFFNFPFGVSVFVVCEK